MGSTDSERREGGYADADCTVTDDRDIEDAWQRTEASASRARRDAQPPKKQTADAETDEASEIIREGRAAMRRIRHANDLIPTRRFPRRLIPSKTAAARFSPVLEQRPQLLSQLRTFLRYYLPTTLRLLEARAKLENDAGSPKAREVRARISQAVGEIDKAFRKQAEALDEYRFIDHTNSQLKCLTERIRFFVLTKPSEVRRTGGTLNGTRQSQSEKDGARIKPF